MHHHVSPPCPDRPPPPGHAPHGRPSWGGPQRPGERWRHRSLRGLMPQWELCQRWHPVVTFGDGAPWVVLVMRWPPAGRSGWVARLPGGSEG